MNSAKKLMNQQNKTEDNAKKADMPAADKGY